MVSISLIKGGFLVRNPNLLATYSNIWHFLHYLGSSGFFVLAVHKPLTNAFTQPVDKASPSKLRHLTYFSQFTSNEVRPSRDGAIEMLALINNVELVHESSKYNGPLGSKCSEALPLNHLKQKNTLVH